jgi:hypothetical protein
MERYDPHEEPDPEVWRETDEQERTVLIEDYHREAGIELPNITLHAAIHAIVENQVAMGDEIPVRETLVRLISEGLDRHDALHAIGSVLAEHTYGLMSGKTPLDSHEPYFERVRELTAEKWRSSDRPD